MCECCVIARSLSHVQLFVTPWTVAHQASLSHTISLSLLKLMSIESVMVSNCLFLCCPFSSCPQSFPAPGSFPMSWLFKSSGQSIGRFSFSIGLSNEHSGLISFRTDWLDLLAVQGTLKSLLQHHSLKASILRCSAFFNSPTLTSIHDYGKNYSFDYMDLCQQSDVSAFGHSV